MDNSEDLRQKLNEALKECARLKTENYRLRRLLDQIPDKGTSTPPTILADPGLPFVSTALKITNDSPAKDKIALFRGLFRGREDVYPLRWERKDGRSGYSPACALEWKRPWCGKPAVKCGACARRKFLPVTDEVIHHHLIGRHTVGVYPLLPDETCWFLVMPISWRGTLQQYVGRLHRLHDDKRVVQVYDYVDEQVPMLMRMYTKRLAGYKAIGYRIEKPGDRTA